MPRPNAGDLNRLVAVVAWDAFDDHGGRYYWGWATAGDILRLGADDPLDDPPPWVGEVHGPFDRLDVAEAHRAGWLFLWGPGSPLGSRVPVIPAV